MGQIVAILLLDAFKARGDRWIGFEILRAGIGDFRYILRWNEINAPLKRNVTTLEVGHSGLYLLSDLGTGMTGEVLHVDAGYHTVGMMAVDEAGQIAELMSSFAKKDG